VEDADVRRMLMALVVPLALLAGSMVPAAAEEPLKPHQIDVPSGQGTRSATLWVQDGFRVSLFAHTRGTPRVIAEAPTGELVVSDMIEGRITILADRDGDGFAEEMTPLLTGLKVPHGLAFADDVLYVAETHRVLRLEPWHEPASARAIMQLPEANDTGGHPNHKTRTLAVGPDQKLYVSIGSFCDACIEADPMRASIRRYSLDGSDGELYASGLRNAVGMTFEPGTDRLWVTENGSNHLGEDLPPDEINVVEPGGGDFGWPNCYGAREVQPPLGNHERCAETVPSALDLPAHIAPLGLTFVAGDLFPAEYHGDLFVALHGSALREDAVGYSLVRVPVRDGQPQQPVEFVRGWLVGGDSWGRPMQPLFVRDGSLLLTDDKAGVIYRIHPSTG
jgi:glucose/arabinose dehydrogenase